jgi:uncharacterized protein
MMSFDDRRPLNFGSCAKTHRLSQTTRRSIFRTARIWNWALLAVLCVFVACMPQIHAQQPDAGTVERQRRVMLEAAERGDVSTINRVMTAGGSVQVRDDVGRTPLHLAIEANRLDVFKLLLAEGADINAIANDLDTPWLLAGARGRTDMLRLMIPKGPDLLKRNRYGGNALIPACHYGHVETVKLLLGTKIDVDHINSLGWTCLLETVILGEGGAKHQEIVRLVLKAGANPNIADKKGDTALSHARARGFTQIIAILEAAGAR